MSQCIFRFCLEEEGQDIIEYSLLITFIAIACMWFIGVGQPSVNAIWHNANTQITAANTSAAS